MNESSQSGSAEQSQANRMPRFRSFFPFVVFSAVFLGMVAQIFSLVETNRWVSQANEMIADLRYLERLSAEMESGLRGFQLTKNPEILEPYFSAKQEFEEVFSSLRGKSEDLSPEMREHVQKTKVDLDLWLAYSENILALEKADNDTTHIARLARGKRLMDNVRADFSRSMGEIGAVLSARKARANSQAEVVMVASILAYLFSSWLVLRNRRQIQTGMAALQRSEKKLQEAVRAREEMVSVVSHDLKNPLSAIQLSAEVLKRKIGRSGLEEKESYLRSVDGIEKSARKASRLVFNMLDLAHLESGSFVLEMAEVSPKALLDDIADIMRPIAEEKGVRLSVGNAPDMLFWCDPERISQVLSNLVGNAVKFTPSGGAIYLDSKKMESGIEISVSDTGPGIPAGQAPFVFDRYWQAQKKGGGSLGLGLAIAKGIVAEHGGELKVDSEPGQGATFSFTLPHEPPERPVSGPEPGHAAVFH